jgi:hypothetical protein
MTNLISPSRRGFLTGLGAVLIAAPAIVRAGSLMPVKAFVADYPPITLNGVPLVFDVFDSGYWSVIDPLTLSMVRGQGLVCWSLT